MELFVSSAPEGILTDPADSLLFFFVPVHIFLRPYYLQNYKEKNNLNYSGPGQNKALTNEKWMNEEIRIYTRCSETYKNH